MEPAGTIQRFGCGGGAVEVAGHQAWRTRGIVSASVGRFRRDSVCEPDEDLAFLVDLQSALLLVSGDDAQLDTVEWYAGTAKLSFELFKCVAGLIADAACFRQTVAHLHHDLQSSVDRLNELLARRRAPATNTRQAAQIVPVHQLALCKQQ